MKTLIDTLKNCDGYFCERVAEFGFFVVTMSVIALSIAQL